MRAQPIEGVPPVDTQVTPVVAQLERAAFSIQEFCARNRISLTTFHKLKNAGLGPKEMRLNTVIRISLDAERDWQEARSNPRGAEAQAKAAAQARASARGRKAAKLALESPLHVVNVKRARRERA
jgi:hypothetical protein